jgi:hypothetical protein
VEEKYDYKPALFVIIQITVLTVRVWHFMCVVSCRWSCCVVCTCEGSRSGPRQGWRRRVRPSSISAPVRWATSSARRSSSSHPPDPILCPTTASRTVTWYVCPVAPRGRHSSAFLMRSYAVMCAVRVVCVVCVL